MPGKTPGTDVSAKWYAGYGSQVVLKLAGFLLLRWSSARNCGRAARTRWLAVDPPRRTIQARARQRTQVGLAGDRDNRSAIVVSWSSTAKARAILSEYRHDARFRIDA